jgi:hypothetical protein
VGAIATVPVDTPPVDCETPLVARRLRWVFCALITVHALDAFAQAVLAGGFLNGTYSMLGLHRDNGIGLVLLGYLQIGVAIAYWRPGGGPAWPLWVCLGISVAETVQYFLGLGRLIGIHVPLGVAIIVGAVMLAQWAWRDTFGRRRPLADAGAP